MGESSAHCCTGEAGPFLLLPLYTAYFLPHSECVVRIGATVSAVEQVCGCGCCEAKVELRVEGNESVAGYGIWPAPSQVWIDKVRSRASRILDAFEPRESGQLLYDLHHYTANTLDGPSVPQRLALKEETEGLERAAKLARKLIEAVTMKPGARRWTRRECPKRPRCRKEPLAGKQSTEDSKNSKPSLIAQSIEARDVRDSHEALFGDSASTAPPLPAHLDGIVERLKDFVAHLEQRKAYCANKLATRSSKDNILLASWRDRIRASLGEENERKGFRQDFVNLVLAAQVASFGRELIRRPVTQPDGTKDESELDLMLAGSLDTRLARAVKGYENEVAEMVRIDELFMQE